MATFDERVKAAKTKAEKLEAEQKHRKAIADAKAALAKLRGGNKK